jgi:hypothetical protein
MTQLPDRSTPATSFEAISTNVRSGAPSRNGVGTVMTAMSNVPIAPMAWTTWKRSDLNASESPASVMSST